jgi:[ribosomal protein S5]-alanine N-acetyltransferase
MNEALLFETQRLILRGPIIQDAQDIFNTYTQDPDVTKYLVWKPHTKYEQSLEWIQYCIKTQNDSSGIKLMIHHKIDKITIGMIEFRIDNFQTDFGYVLSKKYWNKGIMTEAMKPVMDYVFNMPNIYRIWATHDIENDASGKVIQKLGLEYEGTLRRAFNRPNMSDKPRDGKLYALVKN